jgi:hypothetical protein
VLLTWKRWVAIRRIIGTRSKKMHFLSDFRYILELEFNATTISRSFQYQLLQLCRSIRPERVVSLLTEATMQTHSLDFRPLTVDHKIIAAPSGV